MFITPIILLFVSIIYTGFNIKNKFSYILSLYLSDFALMLFVAAVYSSKISYYHFPLRVDYIIYLKLIGIPVRLHALSALYNLTFAVFMLASVCTARVISKFKGRFLVLMTIPVIAFCLLSNLSVMVKLDLAYHMASQNKRNVYLILIKSVRTLLKIMIAVYSALPYIFLAKAYRNTKFVVIKHSLSIYGICITMFNLFFYSFFVFGTFKSIIFYNLNPAGLPINATQINGHIIMPIIMLTAISAATLVLICYHPFNLFHSERKTNKDIVKYTMALNKNYSMNLHTYKNALWSTRQSFELIKAAVKSKDYGSLNEYSDEGIRMVDTQLEAIQKRLESLLPDVSIYQNTDIVSCMKGALEKVKKFSNIRFATNFKISKIVTFGNKQLLTEAFYNILINSLESFDDIADREPIVNIEACLIDGICLIEIKDNGCGIPKSEIKNIFKPFHSSKSGTKNGGIGLSYVDTVIKAHHGNIEIKSRENEFTSFQIALPILKKVRKE